MRPLKTFRLNLKVVFVCEQIVVNYLRRPATRSTAATDSSSSIAIQHLLSRIHGQIALTFCN